MKIVKRLFFIFAAPLAICYSVYASDPAPLSFTTLFSSADAVVEATVTEVEQGSRLYTMTFETRSVLFGSFDDNVFDISIPVPNGFYIPGEPYLTEGDSYIIFLTENTKNWDISCRQPVFFGLK